MEYELIQIQNPIHSSSFSILLFSFPHLTYEQLVSLQLKGISKQLGTKITIPFNNGNVTLPEG